MPMIPSSVQDMFEDIGEVMGVESLPSQIFRLIRKWEQALRDTTGLYLQCL